MRFIGERGVVKGLHRDRERRKSDTIPLYGMMEEEEEVEEEELEERFGEEERGIAERVLAHYRRERY